MSETALPSVEAIKEATLKAFKGKVKDDDIERLLLSLDARGCYALLNPILTNCLTINITNAIR